MKTDTESRLNEFYSQLPGTKRQPYGRIIVAYQNGKTQEAREAARTWLDTCRNEYKVNRNPFWAGDFGMAGCLCNILGIGLQNQN